MDDLLQLRLIGFDGAGGHSRCAGAAALDRNRSRHLGSPPRHSPAMSTHTHVPYREHPLFRSLRDPDALGGRCGRCDWRHRCGGSRARAYAATGDPLAADPGCSYEPARL
jgi:hypothetical protein